MKKSSRIDHIGQNGGDGEHYNMHWPEDPSSPEVGIPDHLKTPEELVLVYENPVAHPKHYQLAPGLEAKDVIEAVLGQAGFKLYCHGNILKYILRAQNKNGDEDFKKARMYIDFYLGE